MCRCIKVVAVVAVFITIKKKNRKLTYSLRLNNMPTYSASFGGRAGRAKGKTPKKKKSKIKCPLCGKNGHEEADCPRAQADSEAAEGVGARGGEAAKGGAGSGITHKTSRRAKGSGKDGSAAPKLALPLGFTAAGDAGALSTLSSISEAGGGGGGGEGGSGLPYLFFDAGCDVGATLDHLTTMPSTRKKSKGSTPTTLYQQSMASSASNYGGAICRQYVTCGEAKKGGGKKREESRLLHLHL